MPHLEKAEAMPVLFAEPKPEAWQQRIEQFGLFEVATPNFNTYFPSVTAADLKPKDEDFIKPVFRLLSATMIKRPGDLIDFTKPGVLKNSMTKMLGQAVYPNHDMNVGNEIGSVASVFWQEGYTLNGIKVPAGMNGQFVIDAKSHPKIARGILMEPPSIHSNSVTVTFIWEPSHKFETSGEFWQKIGTKGSDGKLVRRIVTEITSYYETSLVPHGADPFAKKINDKGKMVNPQMAEDRATKFSDKELYESRTYYSLSFKDSLSFSEDPESTLPDPKTTEIIQNTKPMKNLVALLLTLIPGIKLTEESTEDQVMAELKLALPKLSSDHAAALKVVTDELDGLKLKKTELETQITELSKLKPLADFGTAKLTEKRENVKRLYGILKGENKDATILAAIDKGDDPYLTALEKDYQGQVDLKFPGVCNDCGSHKVSRNSAIAAPESDKDTPKVKTSQQVIQKLAKSSIPSTVKFD